MKLSRKVDQPRPEIQQKLDRWNQALRESWAKKYSEANVERDAPHYEFTVGPKWIKVIYCPRGTRSSEAFVDPENGDVYKAANWNKPAKGARFNLLDEGSFERMLAGVMKCPHGGYLYVR